MAQDADGNWPKVAAINPLASRPIGDRVSGADVLTNVTDRTVQP